MEVRTMLRCMAAALFLMVLAASPSFGDEAGAYITHPDKHIIHMEKTVPAVLDGLALAGGITLVGQGTYGLPGRDEIDGSVSTDLEASYKVADTGEAFVLVESGAGEGVTDEVDCFWGVNADAGDHEGFLRLSEAWYEHRFVDGALTLSLGKLDLTNYFDTNAAANDETLQFLADGFVNSPAVEFPGNSGGVRLTLSLAEYLDLSVGWQAANSRLEDMLEHPFVIAEAGFKASVHGLPGNYRLYGWVNAAGHASFREPGRADKDGWGVGASLDQTVASGVTLFARAGYQDAALYEFDTAWSVGASVKGGPWGRPDDVLGIGWGTARLSDGFKASADAPGDAADEYHLEAYYRIFINNHLEITPDVQMTANALGDGGFGTAWVFGARAQIAF